MGAGSRRFVRWSFLNRGRRTAPGRSEKHLEALGPTGFYRIVDSLGSGLGTAILIRVTLILTCVTDRYCVQSSDRRLTDEKGQVFEEVANKATLLCHFASFSYTGLARSSTTEMTDLLLLRSLALPDLKALDLFENLRKEATRAIRQVPLRGTAAEKLIIRRTSFVGCGFLGIRRPETMDLGRSPDDLHPFLCVVSNAQNLNESWRSTADRDFGLHLGFLELQDSFLLHVAGQTFLPDERTDLERTIRSCIRFKVHAEAVARLLARAIRSVSRRNAAVGPNVMCTFVRRESVGSTEGTFTGGPVPLVSELRAEASYFRSMRDAVPPNWIFSPADPADALHYGPNIACDGTQMTGILMGPTVMVNPPP